MKRLTIILFFATQLFANMVHVPTDYSTIQQGIDAAMNGDTVLVSDGIYFENLIIEKEIVLASEFIMDSNELHIENTIIDGSQPTDANYSSCVLFLASEIVVGDGDINFDGFVNIQDVILSVNFAMYVDTPTDGEFFATDMNGDGAINIQDVILVVNTALGIINVDSHITGLIGFTLQNGYGTNIEPELDNGTWVGGGVTNFGMCPVINYCFFIDNGSLGSRAGRTRTGGGIYTSKSSNFGRYGEDRNDCGGSLNFSNNIFSGNYAEVGNTIYVEGFDGNVDMSNCYFDVYPVSNYWATSTGGTQSSRGDFDFGGGDGESDAIQQDVYINPVNGNDANDGSEAAPFQTIAHAMALVYGSSENPVAIHLADGTYAPNSNGEQFPLTMVEWTSLFGTSEEGTILDAEEHAAALLFDNTESISVELLTVKRGSDDNYGGVFCHESSPTFTDVTFSNNIADENGGGMYCTDNSSPILTRVTFTNNWGYDTGGLMCEDGSNPILTDCVFSQNTGNVKGGGMYCLGESSPSLFNVTFYENWGYDGGGMTCENNSNPTVTNCSFTGNTSNVNGGGIYCLDGASPIIENAVFSGNNAYQGGGLSCSNGSQPVLTDVVIDSNIVNDNGGGIFISESNPSFSNVAISRNTVGSHGGGIYVYNTSNLNLSGATITGNQANDNGGGIYLYYSPNSNISNMTISENSSVAGGGIFLYYSEYSSIDSMNVTGNVASYHGGGVYFDYSDNPILKNSTVTNNQGLSGGGVFTYFTNNVHLSNCEINANTSLYDGGGINLDNSENPTIENTTINNNSATHNGGGIYIHELFGATLTNCEINGNTATFDGGAVFIDYAPNANFDGVVMNDNSAGDDAGGLYIYFAESCHFSGCEISGNIAENNGGAVVVDYSSSPIFENAKFNNNSAGGNGGAIYSLNSPILKLQKFEMAGNSAEQGGGFYFNYTDTEITNGTIANNSASAPYESGGGILPYYSETDIVNTIVWGNTPSQIEYDDWWGTGTNVSYSDIQGGWNGTGNIDANPLFIDAENGNFHLQPESPCIDAGTDVGLPYSGEAPDMGAYETE